MRDTNIYVRVRRPDGAVTELKLHQSKLQLVMDAANRHFGNKTIGLGGPVKYTGKPRPR